MKKRITSFLIALAVFTTLGAALSITTTAADQSYAAIFEKDRIINVEITMSEEDLADMYENAMLEEYHTADIVVDGIAMENVGIRTKGNSSLSSVARSDSNRYSFRIKFNKYVKGEKHKLLGLDDMVLNNMTSDASYMREYLSYEAMRQAGLPVPLTVFVNVYINGELQGLYLGVEVPENSFLNRTFGNNDGNLYKQEIGSTMQYQEGSEYLSSEQKVGDDKEKAGLKNMLKVLNEGGDLESVIDIDSALGYIAANTVLGSYDSYNGQMAQNYYIYENTDGKFYVIPWDYNMSFGGFGGNSSVSIHTPVSGVSMESRPLINKLLEVPEYKARYMEYVLFFTAYLENMPQRVDELAALIRPHVEADPTKFVTMEQFENSIIYSDEPEGSDGMTSIKGMGPADGMPNGMMFSISVEGIGPEVMQKVTEIVFSAGEEGLVEEKLAELKALGLTDEQIEIIKDMSERMRADGMMGGGRVPGGFGSEMPGGRPDMATPVTPTSPTTGSETNTRGNMGMGNGGIRIQREEGMPEGGMPQGGRQRPEGTMPIDGEMPADGEGMRMEIRMGGGMGGGNGSIITYAANRAANIKEQLGETPAEQSITVLLNGNKLEFDVAPMIEDGRTLAPLRAIFEAVGMQVDYADGDITASKDGLEIALAINENAAYVNGEMHELDVPSRIVGERTLVPLRFICESANLTVEWDEATRTVLLTE